MELKMGNISKLHSLIFLGHFEISVFDISRVYCI